MTAGTPSADRGRGRDSRFVFFGGKGGVGKTTCAAAYAIARAARGSRVLVVSTDPAHSLGDAFGVKLGPRPRSVPLDGRRDAVRTLDAVELDAPRALRRWLREHRAALVDVVEHGTWLDRADVEPLFELPLPGVDELLGLIEIVRLARGASPRERYDVVIVDTAPTGHTLRLLAAPASVLALADALDALQEEHRLVRHQLARVATPDAADRVIALIGEQARATAVQLRARSSAFRWVTLPESLSVAESADAMAAIRKQGIAVDEIVVNRVLAPSRPCPVCDRRRAGEQRAIAGLEKAIGGGRPLRFLPALVHEPRGVKALAALGGSLVGPPLSKAARLRPRADRVRLQTAAFSLPPNAHGVALETLPALRGAELIFVGGKGGVGKTTVAAAIGLRAARADPARRVLVLSTDPAHSLGDALQAKLSDEAIAVPGAPPNLAFRELDAAAALAARRAAIDAALAELSHAMRSESGDRAAVSLIELAPPGIDELFGVLSVVDARSRFDLVVMDMAPTGHALRLLEMPEIAREWTQLIMRMLLRYRRVVKPGGLAAELVEASRSLRGLQALVRDPVRTRFVAVTRAASVPRAETLRLLQRLARLKLATPLIVVNARTLDPRRCPWCRSVARDEQRDLAMLRRGVRTRRCAIIQTPLSAPPPRGPSPLDRWAQTWTA